MSKPFCFQLIDDDGNETSFSVPSKWSICNNCDGNGTKDHPAFSNGISREDFAEDEDFRENYFAGHYDVSCDCCNGSGKILIADLSNLTTEQGKQVAEYEKQQREYSRYLQCDAATRRAERGGY